ncbi:tryptophan 2,3-dioxygenase family protein [Streptomyces sp. LP05-1]|uniref:Tryptophan 2,3-dioxygenase family protein n=1 Tax=Streptomyces pyxinae TaxID=2970734 RepID=A0ABT2CNN7_9ACTN|nr:tryptophan 2,3-dioxygenase family protein [Streptomyces sp. LP05-1]MCS0639055.1 tryptophan 2,3-dioxygenase family protein [Streptomyces sp. LP05-1]
MGGPTYTDYLELNTLLSLQTPRSPDSAERAVLLSEQFFIVAHQSCELWLKQIISDLEAAADTLGTRAGPEAVELGAEYLARAAELLVVLYHQLTALEKLPLRHFAAFRPYLGSASGADSAQFRQLDKLLGDERRAGRLYEAFTTALDRAELPAAELCRRGPGAGAYHRVAEALLDVANAYWRWKVGHLALMTRVLGSRPGTGGTSGAPYLASRITLPFPELREARGRLHLETGEPAHGETAQAARPPRPGEPGVPGEAEGPGETEVPGDPA